VSGAAVVAVLVNPDDLTVVVNAVGTRGKGAGIVDGGKGAVAAILILPF
jgi:hypothetical protein